VNGSTTSSLRTNSLPPRKTATRNEQPAFATKPSSESIRESISPRRLHDVDDHEMLRREIEKKGVDDNCTHTTFHGDLEKLSQLVRSQRRRLVEF
jgi:hypothetical protein